VLLIQVESKNLSRKTRPQNLAWTSRGTPGRDQQK